MLINKINALNNNSSKSKHISKTGDDVFYQNPVSFNAKLTKPDKKLLDTATDFFDKSKTASIKSENDRGKTQEEIQKDLDDAFDYVLKL